MEHKPGRSNKSIVLRQYVAEKLRLQARETDRHINYSYFEDPARLNTVLLRQYIAEKLRLQLNIPKGNISNIWGTHLQK